MELGNNHTSEFLDRLKALGFEYATLSGATIGIDDLVIPETESRV